MSNRNKEAETDLNDPNAAGEGSCCLLFDEQDGGDSDSDSDSEISRILDSVVKEEHRRLRHCHAQRRYRAKKQYKRILALQRNLVLLQNYRDALQETVYLQYEKALYQRRIVELQMEPPSYFNINHIQTSFTNDSSKKNNAS
uniref:AlNc14C14G1616 protein n=1 Tax=Albugo laibachii Nc14 TaxID=890382 RepID=F0W3V0_9STRA|nr:AlNc14C14G1616 [Albugo laibachii Nc14]|eukprot:CCA15699.1 AlNc14C14G1616 [Albugo laibachii Nc14]